MNKQVKKAIPAVLLAILLVVMAFQKPETTGSAETKSVAAETKKEGQNISYADNPLRKDIYGAVNKVVNEYYEHLGENTSYIEAYENLHVYTKKCRDKGNYIVFAYYEMKLPGSYTRVPGLSCLYAERRENGEYVLQKGNSCNEEVKQEIVEVSCQEDVETLQAQTQEAYENAIQSDALLSQLLQDFQAAYSE